MIGAVVATPRSISSAPLFALWATAIVLSPVYLFASGSVQLSHAVMAGFVMITLTCYFAPVKVDQIIWLLAGLWLLDVFLVNTIWWVITSQRDGHLLSTILFYTFNVGILLCTASLAAVAPERFRLVTMTALGLALAYEIAVALSGAGTRSAGTFNNPNQLGYWAILVGACWMAMKPREPLKTVDLAVLAGVMALCIISGSRAAMVGMLGFAVVALVWHRPRSKMIPAIAVLAVAGAIIAYATADQWLSEIAGSKAVERFGQEKKHDSLAGRGYDRLWVFPEYLILGAGEGAYERFAHMSKGGSLEIHSTFANALFSYGIVGALLLGGFVWRIFRQAGLRFVALAVPIALYGIAHQGLRTTLLWVFLGIVMARRWRPAC